MSVSQRLLVRDLRGQLVVSGKVDVFSPGLEILIKYEYMHA